MSTGRLACAITGYTCTSHDGHAHGILPFVQGHMGHFKDGSGTDGEILLARITSVIPAPANGHPGPVMTAMLRSHPRSAIASTQAIDGQISGQETFGKAQMY